MVTVPSCVVMVTVPSCVVMVTVPSCVVMVTVPSCVVMVTGYRSSFTGGTGTLFAGLDIGTGLMRVLKLLGQFESSV